MKLYCICYSRIVKTFYLCEDKDNQTYDVFASSEMNEIVQIICSN